MIFGNSVSLFKYEVIFDIVPTLLTRIKFYIQYQNLRYTIRYTICQKFLVTK